MGRRKLPADVRAALKRFDNPYVFDQVDDLGDESPESVTDSPLAPKPAHPAERVAARGAASQADLFSATVTTVDQAPSGNPYQHVQESDEPMQAVQDKVAGAESVSQGDFISGCRRIFAQYIPAFDRGHIRPEHRDFIERNKTRPGTVRARLLAALRRYDLADLTLQPQFNRERGSLAAQKLKEIEQSVGEAE